MSSSATKSLQVLVVDDHCDSAILAAHVLRGVGHAVYTAGTCAEALQIVTTEQIHVVVSDINLPDGDGCKLLVDILACYPVMAIACTGHPVAEVKDDYEQAGFKWFLMKPVEMGTLTAAVAEAGRSLLT